jgi:hypothetical protein
VTVTANLGRVKIRRDMTLALIDDRAGAANSDDPDSNLEGK